jgi:hypothetical protein
MQFTEGRPWRGISNFGDSALTTAPHIRQSTSRFIWSFLAASRRQDLYHTTGTLPFF